MIKAVKPVITKCNTGDAEIDIDVIRMNLEEQLKKDVQVQRNQDKLLLDGDDEEREQREAYYDSLEDFYVQIVEKFDMVDPLDRKLPGDDPDYEDED